jgi:conjugative relaxase-like TrwC/TraI family protein
VVADIAKLSVGREAYYTRELATDHEQYLSGHGESPGRWYGAAATSLGLQGEASPAGFKAMFEGRDPTTSELLGRPHGRNAVPAFDVVLRPTKSVSILCGLGDPGTGRAVLAAHHAGLAEATAYLDEHLGARRGHGGVQHVSGRGLLAVGFDHRTSREGDPLLHTHLVMANRVQGPDGRWTALDGRDLYRHRLAADAIYRATYQRELVRTLGVEWTAADTHGNRELLGMPQDLVRGFSKRTGQIDAELDRLVADGGERTPRLVKWAVHATRKPKEHEAPDTLYGRWRQEAAGRGVDPDTLVRELTGRTRDRDQDRTVSADATVRLFDQLAGPDGLTAHASTFTRPDVLVALGAGLAGAGRTELDELADRFLAERAVSVVADRALEERRWSTPEMLSVEQRLVTGATSRTAEQTALASHQAVRDALTAHPTAGQDQQAMVRDLCQGGHGVAVVVGRAGTGKTFALGIGRHAWQLDGYRWRRGEPTGHGGCAVRIDQSTRDGCVILAPVGELNLAAMPALRRVLLKRLAEQPVAVICDLSGLWAMDSSCAAVVTSVVNHPSSHWPETSLVVCCALSRRCRRCWSAWACRSSWPCIPLSRRPWPRPRLARRTCVPSCRWGRR